MKIFKTFVYALLIFFIYPNGFTLAEETKKQTIAAKVNGKNILMSDVAFYSNRMLDRARANGHKITPEIEKTIRDQWIERMISRELLLQQATKEKIDVSDSDLEKRLKATGDMSAAMSAEKLEQLARDDIIVNIYVEDYILAKLAVEDKEAEKVYNQQKNSFKRPEQIRASHILIKVKSSNFQKKKDAARKKIESILAEVKKGKEDFAELAKKHSEGPSGPKGGDLGYFSRGQMVKPFEKAAFALKNGEVSDIVETQFGYHIIKKKESREARVIPFDEVKEVIKNNLVKQERSKRIETWLSDERSKAKVEILE